MKRNLQKLLDIYIILNYNIIVIDNVINKGGI